MGYPSSIGAPDVSMQGTTLLAVNDHSLSHRVVGSEIIAVETVLGTTLGTNVLVNIDAAGEFFPAVNSSNVFQDAFGGTFNNGVLGTPGITGGTLNSVNINGGTAGTLVGTATTNNLSANWLNVSNGTAVNIGSAAAPTTGQVLTATAGSAATWQAAPGGILSHAGTFTRDMSTGTNAVGYTGVGFIPTSITFITVVNGTNTSFAWGFSDKGTKGYGILQTSVPNASFISDGGTNSVIFAQSSDTNYINGTVATYDADGFTIAYGKANSPSGTAKIAYIAYR